MLIHVVTQKGKGYAPAESRADKYHGVAKFDVVTGEQAKATAGAAELHQGLRRGADRARPSADDRIVAITAAMPSGTGLDLFGEAFPKRCFDVGIAEQHAVTFAAGLAAEGMKPFCAIYSTFLQRAYDQVVHDVAIQNLPVRFAIDRAGLVGADGADPCRRLRRRLSRLPARLRAHGGGRRGRAACTWSRPRSPIDDRPVGASAIRAARASASTLPERGMPLEIGKGRILREGTTVAHPVLRRAAAGMPEGGATSWPRTACRPRSPTRASPSRSTPTLIERLAREHEVLITIEEGAVGGFGSHGAAASGACAACSTAA